MWFGTATKAVAAKLKRVQTGSIIIDEAQKCFYSGDFQGVRDCAREFQYGTFELAGKKKQQHKHKLFGPDFPRTFLTLTPGRPGVKKFLPITGATEKRTFWCGRPRFLARTSMTRRVVEKLCTKKVCVDFLAPKLQKASDSCEVFTKDLPAFSQGDSSPRIPLCSIPHLSGTS